MSATPEELYYLIPFGPDANCTFALCPIEDSVYRYRPTLGANIAFLAIYAVALGVHLALGIRWRSWWFTWCCVAGCAVEVLGYAGRIWMFYDLWTFDGFMIQIVCITVAPVFFCAAIYVLLARTIDAFGATFSRFKPSLFYWVFIPCDIVSLVLQGSGGALSSTSSGVNQVGVDLSLAGLSFQVFTLVCFTVLYIDYLLRYHRSGTYKTLDGEAAGVKKERLTVFFSAVGLAIALILARCIFRVDELSEGYSGPLVAEENLFIGLEGVLISIAIYVLTIGHPGFVFNRREAKTHSVESGTEPKQESGSATDL